MTGLLTLVTSPGNPSKLHLGAAFATLTATGPGTILGLNLAFYYIFNDKLVSAILTGGLMASFGPFVYVGYAVVKSPVFRALLLNPVSRKRMTKDFDGQSRFCRTLFQIERACICIAQLRPGSSSLRSALQFCVAGRARPTRRSSAR